MSDNWTEKQKSHVSMMLVLLVTIVLIEKSYKLFKQNGIKVKCFGNKWNNSQSVSEEELRFIFETQRLVKFF